MKYYKEAEILFNPHFCETSVLFSLIQIIKKQSVDRTKLSLLITTGERERPPPLQNFGIVSWEERKKRNLLRSGSLIWNKSFKMGP